MKNFPFILLWIFLIASASGLHAQDGANKFDYADWEKDIDTLMNHLSNEYTPPRILEDLSDQPRRKWRIKVLANASDEIKERLFAEMESSFSKSKHPFATMAIIQEIGFIKNLTADEIEKVSKFAVDLNKLDQEIGKMRNGALHAYLESFLPNQNVPNREDIAIQALQNPDLGVRNAAAYALEIIGTDKGLKAIKAYIDKNADNQPRDSSINRMNEAVMLMDLRLNHGIVPKNSINDVTTVSKSENGRTRSDNAPDHKNAWGVWLFAALAATAGALWFFLRKPRS